MLTAKPPFENLEVETGITLASIPDADTVVDGFERLAGGRGMSLEAETAILYRVVAMRYSIMLKQIMDSEGEWPSSGSVLAITQMLDMSVDWSEMAPDQERMEGVASNLNRALEDILSELGVRRG
ncbi:hypothetical protein [Stenotrophomonas sp. PFBMAA-4]|uniref:hypothetical protein n=1 Tax=Stenotrophomonas sp. PFBMAA-4 TaxID=3043301 RepID=UPI0024B58C63|nr:hypothetical protein [Stenotrophomonas sp. PFBMAA-4]MDI9273137.1 hypothetical protein [Stenotrophomonas sp. PFBMAA-4]